MKKRYEARGMMEWHPLLSAGKTRVRIPFTGGHLSGYGTTPAAYETSDPVVQAVIERSPHFKSGRIRLASVIGTPETSVHPAPSVTPAPDPGGSQNAAGKPAPKPAVRMSFASLGEASDWLMAEKGVLSSRIMTLEQCVMEAAAHGIAIEITPSAATKKGGLK